MMEIFLSSRMFENDVKIYGIQTEHQLIHQARWFENDVKIYGIQTVHAIIILQA